MHRLPAESLPAAPVGCDGGGWRGVPWWHIHRGIPKVGSRESIIANALLLWFDSAAEIGLMAKKIWKVYETLHPPANPPLGWLVLLGWYQGTSPFALQQMIIHECERLIHAGTFNDMILRNPAIEQDGGGAARIFAIPIPPRRRRLLSCPVHSSTSPLPYRISSSAASCSAHNLRTLQRR